MDYCKLPDENGQYIAYRKLQGKKASIVFFGGFASNMNGAKATAIYRFCQENNIALVLFDYFGHGHSSGDFIDYTISDWQKNCARIISELTSGKQIIIGSSMGGWLMLLTALQFPERIAALIGISSAPDFTEDLIFKQLSDKQKEELDSKGVIDFTSGHCTYKIAKNLIEDGRKNLLLKKETIGINSPVRLLHSINDEDIPYQTSLNLAEKIKSANVEVHLIKSAEHNMSDNHSLKILFQTITELLPIDVRS
ncbi:alpha/beta hydrolase [Wolbachia endosymbiont of Ctenocephalides felis wCfeJ]|uniref:alpha/beta hydrolase n=1 Tax=Wolbachia endosymbiont of Ctenocephalides felis wCfeJ TaxID=2732594 RepID=UPI001445F51A|nr:alpha/beta hydrolase [Wolbachia endosymbiont of Ctenocephalides felis wCfeJ]WCR58100.1 MAG: 2-succinyl-6-hydroxy-2,4-cyclohexadiene-1-carboxylate synthase [Wolbachia endosymbiont of Ctenocephalides felis wCfeJ]